MHQGRIQEVICRLGFAVFAAAIWLAVAAAGSAAAEPLTLKRVLLSSGGVGYFEYEARVSGEETVFLTVPLEQVDDVLKSLVITDDKGGGGSLSLPGREPLAQVFRDYPFGPEALNSPAVLINALQGAEIAVAGARAIRGRVLKVVPETTQLGEGRGTITRHRVSVVTAGGLTQFILEEAESLRFTEPELQGQVADALESLARHRRRNSRELEILALGEGPRTLTVGYVVAVPLWKASYRVTLADPSGQDPAHLQGWALIDNMSGQDWNDVELTLLSGNPVTFRQALYTAYFVNRPDVPVEVLGRVLPKLDRGSVGGVQVASKRRAQMRLEKESGGGLRAPAEAADVMAAAPSAMMELQAGAAQTMPAAPGAGDANRFILAAATEEAATQVTFRLPRSVTVANGHSLMVPIVDRDVPAERLALYQPGTHALHPLAALQLVNDGDSGLPPGVLTLYEPMASGAVSFVGDARLSALPAGDERLVSYALDQKMRADREVSTRQRVAKGKISRGVLEVTFLDEQTTTYRFKAPAREARTLVIEHPRQAGWRLKAAQIETAEVTDASYRVRQQLAPGEEVVIELTLERPRLQRLQLINVTTAQLAAFARYRELDPSVHRAFERIAELRRVIEGHERQLQQLGQTRDRIFQEQKRIRDNLGRVPHNSDLQRRYLTKLDGQESELEQILEALGAAEADHGRAQDALADYIADLEL